jgi:glycosyltransferase involved in cell wall biosynthesis
MRILVVAQDFAWPTSTGSRQRLENIIEALSEIGTVDLFSLAWRDRTDPLDLPDDAPVSRNFVSLYPWGYPFPDTSLAGRLRWVRSGLPFELAAGDFTSCRQEFDAFSADRYDLCWFSRASTFSLLGSRVAGPVIVDIDDLEDHKQRARLAAETYPRSWRGRLHRLTAETQGRLNIRRWATLHAEASRRSVALAVCSTVDVERLGQPNAVVIPNGYRRPATALGRAAASDPPSLLLQGVLFYPPNADGARWLVREVMPLLRAELPSVELRLVGETAPDVDALHAPPGVVVTGRVPSMEPELRRADIVTVPILFGSGTRVKILEAFAHRIPVVSTTLGAEGLGVQPGRHLLVGDDPASFAAACRRLLTEPALRQELTSAAAELFDQRYEWSAIRAAVQDLARSAAAGADAATDSGSGPTPQQVPTD